MSNKVKYHIDSNGEFVIENYNLAGTFSNFLPGIAGLFGIPMWAFYVNRAQAVCSFGVKSKDSPLMEFLPANRAYQLVSSQGFRTFIKIKNNKNRVFYEPFQASYHGATRPVQKMFISPYELRLLEIAPDLGLEVEVTYFTIPNESFAALARRVTLKNTSRKDLSIEVLDGTPLLIPYGVSNFFLQKMRRTVEAWMIVENVGKNAPYYRLKVNPNDISEVSFIEEGNFYLASLNTKGRKKDDVLPVVVDPDVIFGQVKDFSSPVNFIDQTKFKVPPSQIGQNKLPSAMSLASFRLKKGETSSINSLMGHMSSKDKLNSLAPTIRKEQFFIEKRDENKGIIRDIQKDIFTSSGEKKYDLYCGQTFLDNVLRGGYPISCCDHSRTFHVYSRKHGDLERDYNRYFIDPTYFSQGNGNFRDMNQNRRSDVFFNPDVGDSNILHFYNLIQTDGFNPLVLRGVRFKLKPDLDLKITLKGKIEEKYIKKLEGILIDSFTLGELFMNLEKFTMKLESSWQEFLSEILKNCDTIYDAEHGEGFWVDHWTYNLDLVENYLAIYPEKLKEILLDKKEFTFYDNVFCIKPRDKRHVINGNNGVRQYHSLARDEEKESLIKKRTSEPHIVRVANGEGQIYKTNLLVKMLCLTINKLASLDPFGIGIEMEADKPGWCDSLNGLPGLLGSSTPEVFELYRQIVFILDALKALKLDDTCKIPIPKELHDFLKGIESLIKTLKRMSAKKKDFNYWDKSNSLKETYRLKTKLGFKGMEKQLSIKELENMLGVFLSRVKEARKKAYVQSENTYATYFVNEVSKFKELSKKDSMMGLELVKPLAFKHKRLPLYLEGLVRALRIEKDVKKARRLYRALKKTDVYDKELKMYKISESLNGTSEEIGRASIFTSGWLENESIWLHMEYKYLLEILRSALYEEFFEEFRNILVPFQDPEVYQRSVLENSSFIVSSAFPDKKLHGRGFVARLSGSTAEFLNIWLLMNVGERPFFLNEKDELNLQFKPSLPSWLFTSKGRKYAFKFLGDIDVTYHNPRMKNTAGKDSVKVRFIVVRYKDGRKIEIKKNIVDWPYAQDVRDRKVKKMDIYLG